MKWRDGLINRGARQVVVVAVWLEGLTIYDAYGIASDLGIPYDIRGQHENECLLYGSIASDDYRILAMFHGCLPLEEVTLSASGQFSGIKMPGGFARSLKQTNSAGNECKDATDDLQEEVHSLTGTTGGVKLYILVLSIAGANYSVQGSTVLEHILYAGLSSKPGQACHNGNSKR